MILRLRARCLNEKMGDLICLEGRSQTASEEWVSSTSAEETAKDVQSIVE